MLDEYENFIDLPTTIDINEAAIGLTRIQIYYDISCEDVKFHCILC